MRERRSPLNLARRRLKQLVLWVMAWLPRWVRDRWVLSHIRDVRTSLGPIEIKIADTPSEHEQAARLLYQAYVESGLIERRGAPVRVTSFSMLPTTVRFVALVKGTVVATLSLVQDSRLGLPLEEVCGDVVQALRTQGLVLAEIGALGVERRHRGHGLTLLLYKAMWQTAVELGVTQLVATVRPEAAIFYESVLCFKRLVQVSRRYPGIRGDTSALTLDLRTAVSQFERRFGRATTLKRFNPYVFFVENRHPELMLPKSKGELAVLQATHLEAAIRLAWLRPDAIVGLASAQFKALSDAFSSPGAQTGSPTRDRETRARFDRRPSRRRPA